jgi:hypothetical protein
MINFDQKMLFFRDTSAFFSSIALLFTQKAASSDEKLADFFDLKAYSCVVT